MSKIGLEVRLRDGSASGETRSARFRNSEPHQKWLRRSVSSSPTSMGCDSSSSGGSVSGESTSPRLVNTVRNQGSRKRSPSSRPTFTGRDVSTSGGNFSSANVPRRLPTSGLQSGSVTLGGGRQYNGICGGGAPVSRGGEPA